jgi:peptidoglycan/LPS O-acetylase OafA/YrhL
MNATRRRSTFSAIALAAVTPLLEKNPAKTMALDVPVVFSMSRLIVLAFAAGMLRQIWSAGIAGWPDAMLATSIVLALPVLNALDRCTPEQVLALAGSFVGRFGEGAVRSMGSVYPAPEEPSKYDDHRADG